MSDVTELKNELDAVDSMLKDLFIRRMNLIKKANDAYNQAKYVLTLPTKEATAEELNDYYNKFNFNIDELAQTYVSELNNEYDKFMRDGADYKTDSNAVFALSKMAQEDKDPNKINATIGSLFGEEGSIVAFNSVYDSFDKVDNKRKAAYSEGIGGNKAFREAVFNWMNHNNQINLYHDVIATSGGTGAISLAFNNLINPSETILLPEIAWSSYGLIARSCHLKTATYKLTDENNNVSLKDLMLKALQIIKKQHKLVVVINDPCQNPTGITLGSENWKLLIEYFNTLTEYGKVVVVNDVAYIDYCYNDGYDYMKNFNYMNKDVLMLVAYSCSKTLTAYGCRVGAAVIMSQDKEELDKVSKALTVGCRALWSNVNTGFMDAAAEMFTTKSEQFKAEKAKYVDLLQQRSSAFVSQANEVGLPIYPYTEGFFVTVRVEDKDLLAKYHAALLEKHIYTLKVTKGIRVAICSMAVKDCERMPKAMKEILEELQNA